MSTHSLPSSPAAPLSRARRRGFVRLASAGLMLAALGGCGEHAKLDIAQTQGTNPQLPAPTHSWVPTVKIADNVGWSRDEAPVPAPGLQVAAFARGLDHPRWLLVLPNGDVLVAESNAPAKREDGGGIRGFFQKMFMKKAGGASPSADRITLLRDANGDGVAETRTAFLTGLHSPFGMALVRDTLYVADADRLIAFPYQTGETAIHTAPRLVTALPGGPRNHHWTKNVIASPDGSRLFVTVGSNSNVGENGMAEEAGRAAIWEVDPATGRHAIWASGLRNPNGMAFLPGSDRLYTVVNERDEIGSDIVPDYLTHVPQGGFFGWPWTYWGDHPDERVKAPRPPAAMHPLAPDYAMGPHTASLGLAFSPPGGLGGRFAGGAFVGQHGSWNRNPPSGYRVVFVPFAGAQPTGKPQDVLTGFLVDGKARGRPVGVAIAQDKALLVADDAGGMIWRVTPAGGAAPVRTADRTTAGPTG